MGEGGDILTGSSGTPVMKISQWLVCELDRNCGGFHLYIGQLVVWLDTQCPYFIHDHSKAPHVTGSGVLLVVESLWSCPFHRDFPSTRDIVVSVLQTSRHAKVCNLQVTYDLAHSTQLAIPCTFPHERPVCFWLPGLCV